MKIPAPIVAELEKKQYFLHGHSAVQICGWNKKVLQGKSPCYKQVFYGIHTHRCMEFSPAAIWCSNRCVYCWRPIELMGPGEFKQGEAELPEKLVPGLIEERRKLLSGFGGRTGVNLKLWRESMIPDHFAISLSGEPTVYPLMPELIRYLRDVQRARSIFLVTNGTYPEAIARLVSEKALPHQLYISLVAATEPLYKKIVRPRQRDAWERFNRSAGMLRYAGTRSVVRLTVIKGMNDSALSDFGSFIEKTGADFVEVKAYMYLGYSRDRLKIENMPLHADIVAFSEKLNELLPSYEYLDEHKPSRIVLLRNKKTKKERFIPT